MKFKQAFSLALKSMAGSKVRAFLTMLGIIIGVAAVIVLVSLVGGFSKDLTDQFASLGTNTITVYLTGRGGNTSALTPDDFMAFAEEHMDIIEFCSPVVQVGNATLKNGTKNMTSSVSGGSENYHHMQSYKLMEGRVLAYSDVMSRSKTALIGTYVAQELYEGDALGQTIKINGESFTVVGLLAEKADSTEGSSDQIVIIPYTSAQRLGGNTRVASYSITASSTAVVEAASTVLNAFLLDKFGDTNAYRVMNVSEMLSTINELTSTLSMILGGIASISLLVGGIGIMNIMLVSVTERTKEIGIRKSLGGKRRDIMLQFVIEAATTSAVGGVIGIVFGVGAAMLVASLFDMSSGVSVGAIAIAFSVSVGIGIIFGYFPASRAAKLNPIDALRYE